jgi:TetR/AcrR family transcriptional repressor of nem operon
MVQSITSRSVGRPREFDEEAALEAAMDAFWAKGYEATSMTDLCSCTGLHKGSLYQAFGDKHTLFMNALKHYADTEFRDVAAVAFQSDSPLANIRAAVGKICADAGSDKGCLMINAMVELAPHDEEVKKALKGFGQQRIRVMTDLIAKAQELGEIKAKLAPHKLARQLMTTLAGAATMVKGLLEPEEMSEVMEDLLDSWT